jgi:hypothetical protein
MEESFNSKEYVRYVAEELISEFERAGKATTPVLVGSARETAIRAKLASLFPSYVGVGTGCVIDTFGKTSKQTDIILYEKDICPVYSINNTPETTYYPCEGVIGVGEVKSTLTKSELEKAFKNIASTKECQRYYPPSKEKTGYRNFGSNQPILGVEVFDQKHNFKHQIYGFILCQKIGSKLDTFMSQYIELLSKYENHLTPNVLVSLEDGVFTYYNDITKKLSENKKDATGLYNVKNENGDFQFLLFRILEFLKLGCSSPVFPTEKYVIDDFHLSLNGYFKSFKF